MCKRNVSLMITGVLIDGLVRCIVAIDSWALELVLSELVCRLQYLIVEARTCEAMEMGSCKNFRIRRAKHYHIFFHGSFVFPRKDVY